MLSANEIAELEKKVARYRLKQRVYSIALGVMVVCITLLSIYVYPDFFQEKQPIKALSSNETISHDVNLSISQKPLLTAENNVTTYTPPPVSRTESDDSLKLNLPEIEKSVSMQTGYSGVYEEEMESKRLMRKLPLPHQEDLSYKTKEEKLETALLPPPLLLEEPKAKGFIQIETKEVNSLQYLKERFEKTHNIVFALMLSEEYYKNKNYSESNKWALIANNMESENEKSWILFAKSKFKLGQKEDAVIALQAYLKSNKSKAAQGLLNQINMGANVE